MPVPIASLNAGLPRVRVVGRLISLDLAAGTAILDDGAASTTLILERDEIRKVKEGALVRVFGKPGEDDVKVGLVQDMGALDFELFKKVSLPEVENEY